MEGLAFVRIADPSQPAEARRIALQMADAIGFTENARGKLGIVVTEAATNILKHAGGGQIILRSEPGRGVGILALDKGPGMRSVEECSRDGYSTVGSPGTGLGAIQRLATLTDVYSVSGGGATVWAFCASEKASIPNGEWDGSVIVSPLEGEFVSGDAAAIKKPAFGMQAMIADGLGHGPLAADASNAARRVFADADGSPQSLLEEMHAALTSTRGAAVGIVEISQGIVRFCGIGNISAVIVTGDRPQHMVSMNGIVGHGMIRPRQFEYQWHPGSVLIMYSDGISSRWQLGQYPGLAWRHSSVIAGTLFRDFRKINDDATVLVAKAA